MRWFVNAGCIDIINNRIIFVALDNTRHLISGNTPVEYWNKINKFIYDSGAFLDTDDRVWIGRMIEKALEQEVQDMVSEVVESAVNDLSRLKMYILVREDIGLGHAINCVGHAAASAVLNWNEDDTFQKWKRHSFRKVTCKVSRQRFEEAKQYGDYILISEDVLNDTEVALAFKPRETWPEFFKKLKLYS